MILADNGSACISQGRPTIAGTIAIFTCWASFRASNFEAVDVSSLMIDPNSGQAKQSTTVSVTVSPSAATVPVNTTAAVHRHVTNATTQNVNWTSNGAPGGNSTVGLITTSGLYTAPAVPPSGGTVTVQAASTVSPSAMGTL